MESERYLEGNSLKGPSFFENINFTKWKNRFESYVKSIDQDLWHVFSIDDFQPTEIDFENQTENFKRKFYKKL